MQSINIGDKVSFINESLDGKVTSIKANGLIGVTIEDDFELEVSAKEIVVIESTVKKVADKINIKQEVKATEIRPENSLKPELYWFITDFKDGYDLHLANLRDHPYLFTCYRKGTINIELVAEGKVESGEYKKLLILQGKEPLRWGTFEINLLAIRNLPSVVPTPVKGELSLNQDILQNPTSRKEGKPYWLIAMQTTKLKPLMEEITETPINIEPIQVNTKKPAEIIDLHANELGIDGLDADHILKKQMEVFYYNLELAIAYKMPKIIFIHGVGNGVLKNLITLAVKGNKNVAGSTAADYSNYGNGATELRLRN